MRKNPSLLTVKVEVFMVELTGLLEERQRVRIYVKPYRLIYKVEGNKLILLDDVYQ